MYSHEIKKLLELKNNLLEVKEYLNIVDTSSQIDHIIYKDDEFNLFTNDDYQFKVKIKEIGKN